MFLLAQATSSSSAGVAGASIVFTLVWLVVCIAMLVAAWKVFVKAGRPGWASLIPFYNTVVLLQITGHSGWWLLGMFVPLLNFFVIVRLVFNLATVFGHGIGFGFGLLLLSPIFILILGFGDSRYVGPAAGRAAQFPSAPAPLTT